METLFKLRKYRKGLVQQLSQYSFAVFTIVDELKSKKILN
jgi:protein tyrosine phosphatase